MTTTTLDSLALFEGLSAQQQQAIQRAMLQTTLAQGTIVFSAGEPATCLYMLLQGLIKVTYITPDGHERILNLFEQGDIFGELFLGHYRHRIGQCQAVTTCTVYKLPEDDLYQLIDRFPRLGVNFIRHLVDSQRETLVRMQALLRHDARPRLLALLMSLSRRTCCTPDGYFVINHRITQEDLANMAGLNRSTVSSTINALRREGILGGHGRHLTVHIEAAERALAASGFELLS